MTSRRLLIAGNWKMNGGLADARRWAEAARGAAADATAEVLLLPPYPWLLEVGRAVAGSEVRLGAQACHTEPWGAFTGGVSAEMLKQAGCAYVLCGHSERRRLCGETDTLVGEALKRAVEAGLTPILCVGETLDERRGLQTQAVLARQVEAGLAALSAGPLREAPLWVAYEPVWAIGTGVVATPAEVRAAHATVRAALGGRTSAGEPVGILYGGSVKPDNMEGLLAVPDVDGFLVGGASLDPGAFAALVRARRRTPEVRS